MTSLGQPTLWLPMLLRHAWNAARIVSILLRAQVARLSELDDQLAAGVYLCSRNFTNPGIETRQSMQRSHRPRGMSQYDPRTALTLIRGIHKRGVVQG